MTTQSHNTPGEESDWPDGEPHAPHYLKATGAIPTPSPSPEALAAAEEIFPKFVKNVPMNDPACVNATKILAELIDLHFAPLREELANAEWKLSCMKRDHDIEKEGHAAQYKICCDLQTDNDSLREELRTAKARVEELETPSAQSPIPPAPKWHRHGIGYYVTDIDHSKEVDALRAELKRKEIGEQILKEMCSSMGAELDQLISDLAALRAQSARDAETIAGLENALLDMIKLATQEGWNTPLYLPEFGNTLRRARSALAARTPAPAKESP